MATLSDKKWFIKACKMSIFSAEVLNKENMFDLGATIHIIINEFANLYTRHTEPSQDIKSEKIQQHTAVFET